MKKRSHSLKKHCHSEPALDVVHKTLKEEGLALLHLAEHLNKAAFHRALDILFHCEGHVIVSGMGKSGHVGKKIAATLASTGTPSFFIHPSEAYHGDLGMITKNDVMLLISNSGETNEILQLLPSLKSFAKPVIAICNDPKSTLATHADVVLELLMDKETCPNNLAPTTSTTLTIALGDALAIALMHKRGFNPNDFAKYHPGGRLGRKLLTPLKDVMIKEDLPFVTKKAPLKEVVQTMTKTRVKGLAIVTNDQKKLLGVITDGDIRRLLTQKRTFENALAHDIMTTTPHTVYKSQMLIEAEEIITAKKIKQLIVLDDQKNIVGVFVDNEKN